MKKTVLTIIFAACGLMAAASPVSLPTARQVAETFWRNNLPAVSTADELKATLVEGTGFTQLYIFDIDNGKGFVIVSADDCAYPVLGYSMKNPAGELGANIRFWLNQYEQEIAFLVAHETPQNDYIASQWRSLLDGSWQPPKTTLSVSPMLTTQWNQSPYYNDLCPTGTPAGCTAIAVAQVMRYWSHPAIGIGSHSYSCGSYGIQSANFGNTTYDWTNMPNRLTSSSSSTQVNAVATLCYHVGVSMNMEYEPSGSGAPLLGGSNSYCAKNALVNYFGYRSTLQGVYKSNYTDAAWVQLLKDELDASRPIPYAGFDPTAGHAFVFHGYNSSSQFYINWGWGGSYDGYFSMGALNPAGGGTGTNGSNTFNSNNQALIGVMPSGALRLSTGRLNLPQDGTAASFVVSSNTSDPTAWTATAGESWVTLTPTTGNGNGALTTVSVSASPNTTGRDRTATVTVIQNSDTATLLVSQLACNTVDMCQLTINMTDRHGDGWEGAYLTFSSTNGTLYGTATVGGGTYAIETIPVCPDTVVVEWHTGSYDSECGFTIRNSNNIYFFNHSAGTSIPAGVVLVIPTPCDTTGGIAPVTYTLTGVVNDSLFGQVTGTGSGLSFGTTRTLKAEANPGYRFVKWQDNSTENPRSVIVTSNQTYTALFADLGGDTLRYDNGVYNTALSAGNNMKWGIKIPSSALTSRPQLTGVQFYNVYSGTYTLTISSGTNIRPTDQLYQGSITLGSQYTQCWITLNFDNPVAINTNKTLWITLSAPSVSYPAAMTDWCGNEDGAMISTNGGSTWKKLSQLNRYGTWMMRAILPVDNTEYTVTAQADSHGGGTVEGGGVYRNGTRCTLRAIPDSGYHFVKWSNNLTQNPYSFVVSESISITAHFDPDNNDGIEAIDGQLPDIRVAGKNVTLVGAEGREVSVYDLMGRCLHHISSYDGKAFTLPVTGVYMVRVDDSRVQRIIIH